MCVRVYVRVLCAVCCVLCAVCCVMCAVCCVLCAVCMQAYVRVYVRACVLVYITLRNYYRLEIGPL